MDAHPVRGAVAGMAAAILTVTFASSALAAEAEPAAQGPKVTCDGKVATIVGTPGPDKLVGTAKRDIIAGLGGNDIILGGGGDDIICGGPGNDRITGNAGKDKLIGQGGRDRLFGGDGPDRLFGGPHDDFLAGQAGPDVLGGGPGNDRLDGGIGVDTCAQNTGTGPMVRCELPRSVFAPTPPPAAAPPPPPTPPPAPKVLVIAYADLDGSHTPTSGDVMISQIVDTNLDGWVSIGDTIEMGMYPTTAAPQNQSQFAAWGVRSHAVADVWALEPDIVVVESAAGFHEWWRGRANSDDYFEWNALTYSDIWDHYDNSVEPDIVDIDMDSPSEPATTDVWTVVGVGDDRFIDVDYNY